MKDGIHFCILESIPLKYTIIHLSLMPVSPGT